MKKEKIPDLSKQFISAREMCKVAGIALKEKNGMGTNDTAVIFYDLDFLDERTRQLKALFPPQTIHAIAAKANPLAKILLRLQTNGVGLEVASLPEMYLAEKSGFHPSMIVFDSPSKTRSEIEYALRLGVYINADSFDELDRISEIVEKVPSKSIVGVRVNPQVGQGSIGSTSVAGTVSKFGIPLDANAERLMEYYVKYDWLQGIHVHIGSQGCPVSLIIKGIKKVLNFSEKINKKLEKAARPNRIGYFDMGGGLPVSYRPETGPETMKMYYSKLTKQLQQLFTGQYKLITEFGRYLHANSAWVASRVEYVKKENDHNILMIHVGADLFLRKCYNPNDWHHHITIADKNGKLKKGKIKKKYIVAGPLCFAGDIIARDIELPEVEEGDLLLIHDAGAYTLSMWSRYNSRQIPKIVGYSLKNKTFEIIKQREKKEDIFKFWS